MYQQVQPVAVAYPVSRTMLNCLIRNWSDRKEIRHDEEGFISRLRSAIAALPLNAKIYRAGRQIICEVLLCFLLEVSVTNGAKEKLVYQPNSRWNIPK